MNGLLLNSGKLLVSQLLTTEFNISGVYVGLMETTGIPAASGSLSNSGIIEVSGVDRAVSSGWVSYQNGDDVYTSGQSVTFNFTSTIPDVNGYFVSLASGSQPIWSEQFPTNLTGSKYNSDVITIYPIYKQE